MFGRRIVRDEDVQYDRAEKRALELGIAELRTVIDTLRERLIAAEGLRASAQTMRDGLITRVNVLEEENAVMRHKLTGLPQIAPKIEKGTALQASNIGAQADLFEDVGDLKAAELKTAGLLHDDEMPMADLPFPSARGLTEHLQ